MNFELFSKAFIVVILFKFLIIPSRMLVTRISMQYLTYQHNINLILIDVFKSYWLKIIGC